MLLPELYDYHITRYDKEILRNAKQVSNYILSLIKYKRETFAKTGKYEGEDLLTILLQDEVFQDNDKMIMEECLTFFIAGT